MTNNTNPSGNGHSTGTVPPEKPAAQGRQRSRQDVTSLGWPRLLTIRQAGSYLGLGEWTVRELINSGQLPVTKIERPRTASAMRRSPLTDMMRMIRLDRADLDAFVESCAKERANL